MALWRYDPVGVNRRYCVYHALRRYRPSRPPLRTPPSLCATIPSRFHTTTHYLSLSPGVWNV
eukprot:5694291-Prymnesium_polylepis.1